MPEYFGAFSSSASESCTRTSTAMLLSDFATTRATVGSASLSFFAALAAFSAVSSRSASTRRAERWNGASSFTSVSLRTSPVARSIR